MANAKELQSAIEVAKARFDELKDEYPELKPYLVFSCPQGRIPIDARPQQILATLPQMVVDSDNKTIALRILAELQELKQQGTKGQADLIPQIKQMEERLAEATEQLIYSDDVNVEIRLARLECTSEERTEQKLAARRNPPIRVVLAALGELSEEYRKASA